MERNPAPQEKAITKTVGRNLHRARSEAVHGVRLVIGARHQACKGELHALGGIAPENEAVERVEGQQALVEDSRRRNLRENATLGGARVDIIEMFEVGLVFEIAEGRDAMALG